MEDARDAKHAENAAPLNPTDRATDGRDDGYPFALICNQIEISAPLPRVLLPGHILRAPTSAEVERLREEIRWFGGGPGDSTHGFEPQRRAALYGLPEVEHFPSHLYYVVQLNPAPQILNSGLNALHNASLLHQHRLDFSIMLHSQCSSAVSSTGVGIFRHMNGFPGNHPVLDAHYFDAVVSTASAIESRKGSQPNRVDRALSHFTDLFRRPVSRPLYVIGLFQTLECLLTHDPKRARSGHNISHQLSFKAQLLDRRLETPTDYSVFSGSKNPATVWEKLYAYRSAFAHGSSPDFESTLNVLGDDTAAVAFLLAATRAYLRHSLVEPQLILDLAEV